jgi:hypothetical protein
MGVESKFYILPETSHYRPEPSQVRQLIHALRSSGFLCDPKSPTFTESTHREHPAHSDFEGFHWKLRSGSEKSSGSLDSLKSVLAEHPESDAMVEWPNSNLKLSGLNYPLTVVPGPEGVYYDIEIHLTEQTVYHTSEIIDPFDEIICSCGSEIEPFEPSESSPLYDPRLPNLCPSCRTVMNYAPLSMKVRDGWTGDESEAAGGVTYRFAIIVDCGKCWPESEATVTPEFLAIVEKALGITTRVFRDFY